MGIARAGSKSDYRWNETWTRGTSLKELIETIPTNMARAGVGAWCSTGAAEGDVEETCGVSDCAFGTANVTDQGAWNKEVW
jgi:hypothetical protein